MKELKIIFKWENKKSFEMIAKEEEFAPISIIKAEENACMVKIWESIDAICKTFITGQLQKIGDEMKKE